ncbi:Aristolochene synthase prx2 [Labeo rohita]|uniref:Aristolochene synthase prx2 n=1 Tax=Labeo rohita TaxID=84645 RepID=A0ABQ8MEF8_LABRO|nr:Aristolochene synthase prx2 [Labeo rohita]
MTAYFESNPLPPTTVDLTNIATCSHIINTSLTTGTFPSAFKQAWCSKESVSSLLFFSLNNLLDANQSGYKSGHFRENALLTIAETLRLARMNSVLILLGLSEDFDTINHQIHLATLSGLGIRLNSYLTGRWMRMGVWVTSANHQGASRLDSCSAPLVVLPTQSAKPLQMIQNMAACLDFNHSRTFVTLLLILLHWLLVVARNKFKVLTLAFWNTTGTAPPYVNSLLQMCASSCQLRSLNEPRLIVPSQ